VLLDIILMLGND